MILHMGRQAKITDVHRKEAAALKGIWDSKARKLGLTQETFGYSIGKTQGAIGHFLNARTPLNLPVAQAFAQALDCDLPDFSPRLDAERDKYIERVAFIFAGEYSLIPVKSPIASMGPGMDVLSEHTVDHLAFKTSWLRDIVGNHEVALVHACGTSMSPTIQDGNTVLIDLEDKVVKPNKIYGISRNNDFYIKRLKQRKDGLLIISDEDGDDLKTRTAAAEFVPAEEADNIIVIGRVIWTGGKV